ncbi:MAG: HAD family phosphatase [Anaerolineales bacterium]|nr:HAD family phosphatase [Anaerolineales bacterium]
MPIKAVIWDIGGVIARTEDPSPRDQLAADLGVTRQHLNHLFFSGPQGTRAQKGEISTPELMAYIRRELNLAPGEYPDLRERFFAGDRVDGDLVAFIRSLKPDYKTGIISNAWGQLPELLQSWGILEDFDVIIGSGDEGVIKPDPRIYHLALAGLEVQAGEAVFVDDFIENVEAARKLGMHAVHFRNPGQALQELKALMDKG